MILAWLMLMETEPEVDRGFRFRLNKDIQNPDISSQWFSGLPQNVKIAYSTLC